jgi:hypothetical protein
VPVGVTGHQTQRPRGQVATPPGPHPAQRSPLLGPWGARWCEISAPCPLDCAAAAGLAAGSGSGLRGAFPFKMEFLSLTEPILALCAEADREACELRYADPFPESHHRMLP